MITTKGRAIKLLFDENLAPRLAQAIADVFPESVHVRDVKLQSAADPAVWDFAAANGFVIVSKDADFRQRSILFGPPPKVIGLLVGNCPTSQVELVLRTAGELIDKFEADPAAAFLELP